MLFRADGALNDGGGTCGADGSGRSVGPTVHLASRSPRRRELLHSAGIDFTVVSADVDDGDLCQGCACAAEWVMSLAYLKAAAAWRRRTEIGVTQGLVLGADTVCVLDGKVIGQPASAEEAGSMIRSFSGRSHEVVTGVCLLDANTGERDLFAVAATVTLGELSGSDIDGYTVTDAWRGKAGGYNYDDRLRAGWPLECEGDPTAVTGLPMIELVRRLDSYSS